MRSGVRHAFLLGGFIALVWASEVVHAQNSTHFDLPAQALADALRAVGSQTKIDVLFNPKLVAGRTVPAIKANLTVRQALSRLLEGTGLRYQFLNERTVIVATPDELRQPAVIAPPAADPAGKSNPPRGSPQAAAIPIPVKTSPKKTLDPPENSRTGPTLEEVVVTAQKVAQPLLDVPVPVTAISAATLIANNEVRLQDYFATVPGLNFTTDGNGAPILSIRGMTTGVGNPTTSVTIDGVPFGSSSQYGGQFALLPDIDPSNLERVEVLRGPQGTLYGASSLGGLINYVTVDPSTQNLSGHVEADLSTTENAEDLGSAVRGAVNAPISDTVAIRMSGFLRRTPGYIDNVLTGEKSTNRVDAGGGYLSLLLRPVSGWSLRLSALYQGNEGHGSDYADPGLGDLKQANIPGTGIYHSDLQSYSAIFNAGFGAVHLTALSGYNVNSMHDVEDATNSFGAIALAAFGVDGVQEPDRQRVTKVSQEVRLTMPVGQRVDWMLGLFYTHEKAHVFQQLVAEDITTGAVLANGNMLDANWPTTYTDAAVFTNMTVRFTDRFDIQLGGRESANRQTYSEVDGGGYTTVFGLPGAPAPLVTPEVDTKDNSFTYLLTPRYRMSRRMMVYARLATGFRPGGPNPTCSAFNIPCHFDPDRTRDYEVGLKGYLLDHRLAVDASIFYIDWKHIQIQTYAACNCALLYTNAGSARSQGAELSAEGRPASGLMLRGWIDLTDAVLTADFPSPTVGGNGDRLPFSSRYSANLSADQELPISERVTAFVGGQVSYVGSRLGYFESEAERPYYPAYAQTNVRAGIMLGEWRVTLFANNVTNRRGALGGTLPLPYGGNGYSYIQPRTIGVSVATTL